MYVYVCMCIYICICMHVFSQYICIYNIWIYVYAIWLYVYDIWIYVYNRYEMYIIYICYNIYIYLHINIHTSKYEYTDRHTYIQADRQTDIQTYRQADRQTDIQTNRQTDKQTYIHTYINTYPMIFQMRLLLYDFWPPNFVGEIAFCGACALEWAVWSLTTHSQCYASAIGPENGRVSGRFGKSSQRRNVQGEIRKAIGSWSSKATFLKVTQQIRHYQGIKNQGVKNDHQPGLPAPHFSGWIFRVTFARLSLVMSAFC